MSSSDPDPSYEPEPSRGGWSDAPSVAEAVTGVASGHDERDRYVRNDLLGAGGMGQVHAVLDTRLGREVALKEVGLARGSERRLAREAAITSRLEHPGIVPVYDAGRTEEGRRFYTMRLVRGRSLGQALAAAGDIGGRLALLPHLIDACHAAAYAHSRGVVHRDLKPANIMVGSFGETLVVDWGLAGFVSEQARETFASGLANAEILGGRQAGPLGTAAFASPEQSEGTHADPRADVFSLGAILFVFLTGEGPRPEGVRLAEASGFDPADAQTVEPRAPLELCAIARRCLATDPRERYADASQLALELERFARGQRVLSHAYSAWELGARFVRAWRAPLSVAAVALLLLGVVGALALRATQAELEAERTARDALLEADATLTWSLHGQAATRGREGAFPEASILAATALAREGSPPTRGALAMALAGTLPSVERLAAVPSECLRVALSPDGQRFSCAEADRLTVRFTEDPSEVRWQRAGAVLAARPMHGTLLVLLSVDRTFVVIDTADERTLDETEGFGRQGIRIDPRGRWAVTSNGFGARLVDADTGQSRVLAPLCGMETRHYAYSVAEDGRVAAACGDGRVVVRSSLGELLADYRSPFTSAKPAADVAFTRAGVALGGLDGSLTFLDDESADARPALYVPGRAAVRRVQRVGDGDLVAVTRERGGIELWNLAAGAELGRLPERDRRALIAPSAQRMVTAGDRFRRWSLPDATTAAVLHAPAGFAHVTLGERWLAAAGGDGHLRVWDRASGRRVLDRALSERAVMWSDFAPDETTILVGLVDGGGTALLDTGDWSPRQDLGVQRATRRVGWLADRSRFALYFGAGVQRWRDGATEVQTLEAPELRDMHIAADRSGAALLADDGRAFLLRVDGELTPAGALEGARAIAMLEDQLVLAGPRLVISRDDTELRSVTLPPGPEVLDVAASPTGRWIAVALEDGRVLVLRASDLVRVADIEAHHDRVAAIAFGSDDELWSASWDATVRRSDLSALSSPPADVAAELQQAWDLEVREALREVRLRDL